MRSYPFPWPVFWRYTPDWSCLFLAGRVCASHQWAYCRSNGYSSQPLPNTNRLLVFMCSRQANEQTNHLMGGSRRCSWTFATSELLVHCQPLRALLTRFLKNPMPERKRTTCSLYVWANPFTTGKHCPELRFNDGLPDFVPCMPCTLVGGY